MPSVREIDNLAELASLRPVWAKLLSETAGATFFQSLDWLETYWQFNGQDARLRVLVIEDGGQPLGILPLAQVSESSRAGRVRVLSYPLNGWGSFYSPIGANPAATLEAGIRYIRQTRRDWDVLDLRWIDPSTDDGQTGRAMQAAGFHSQSQLWHESAQIELDHGWNPYWASRKSTWRSNVRRCGRLLARHGEVEHIRFRPLPIQESSIDADAGVDFRWDLYDACVELAERSWQGSSTSGTTLSHESIRDYLRAAHAAATKAGAVDLNLLVIDGRPVAFAYNYHWRGWVYGLRSGFDAAGAQDGAGNVLMAHMIEDSCRRGDRLIDLGPNYLDCKRYWITRLAPAMHCTYFNPVRLKAQALRIKRIVKRWLGWTSRAEKAPREFVAISDLSDKR